MFHINIRNFHNNDRPNKTALTILSQLKITKVNIIENFGNENNIITLENARVLKRKKKSFFIVRCLPQWSFYCCLNFESFRQINIIDVFSKTVKTKT